MKSNQSSTSVIQSALALVNDKTFRSIAYQIVIFGSVFLLGWFLVSNTLNNLEEQDIATGFGFLDKQAAFGISESVIDYAPSDTYARALLVGILNTLKVSLLGIILATVIGTLIGIGLVSPNWLLRFLGKTYIETFRNIPLLLQLFFWYSMITNAFPSPSQALNPVKGVFLTNRGLYIPVPAEDPAWTVIAWSLVAAVVAFFLIRRWGIRRLEATGQPFPYLIVGAGIILALPLLAWLFSGAPTAMDIPTQGTFSLQGGAQMSPEFAALLAGLTIYTATYIAEIVRSGIQSVPYGQTEAATALGLKSSWIMRLIVLPQALRVIIPPMTNQYLNLTKNSSLAVAIGYPDLVSISNTTMNQTGQAVEAVAIFMTVYLSISLSISAFMNWYNKRMALVEE